MFEEIVAAPPDPILGLTEAFSRDPNPQKLNLAVGLYKDAEGVTPVLGAVKAAERKLVELQGDKSYLPITGSPTYARCVQELLLGPEHPAVTQKRLATAHTPGGSGGLRVIGDYLAVNHGKPTVWISEPTWPNHPGIFQAAGLTTRAYPYFDARSNALDFGAMLSALDRIPAGDVVLLHGCCHNPTGVDPDVEQWKRIARVLAEREVLPLFDFAYQGFGAGVEEDAAGLRALIDALPELIICSSFSKNFGLYNERVGALTIMGRTAEQTAAVMSRVKTCIRRNYSNPPAHGGEVVAMILTEAGLRQQWLDELEQMRGRINGMRAAFTAALDARGVTLTPEGNGFIARQKGMFTLSGLTQDQVQRLRDEHSIYIVGSGRINVAGMNTATMDRLCDAIAEVIG